MHSQVHFYTWNNTTAPLHTHERSIQRPAKRLLWNAGYVTQLLRSEGQAQAPAHPTGDSSPPPHHSLLLTIVLVELVDKGAHTIVPQLDDAIM